MEAELYPYSGTGKTISERNRELKLKEIPEVRVPAAEDFSPLDDPADYVAEKGLRDAVNAALLLSKPLLVTGEPGTGKTQLASSIAHELELPTDSARPEGVTITIGEASQPRQKKTPEPITFYTKTTSTAKDLFYRYDALRHFQDVQLKKEKPIEAYISFEALGKAILLADEPARAIPYLPENLQRGHKEPVRSVVLIDEVDKAPRDFPNDILNEIENMAFEVKELDVTFKAQREFKPIVILTSNSEKNLPDAFLRRCVFYNIPFPDTVKDLKPIIDRRLKGVTPLSEPLRRNAIDHFLKIRKLNLKKKPATAELLSWMRLLENAQTDVSNAANKDLVISTYAVLAKNDDDMRLMREKMWS